jgi:hypothetical protein
LLDTEVLVSVCPVADFPGYRVTDDGRVQSCWSCGRRPSRMTNVWRDLKPAPQHRGHLAVCLVRDHKKHTRFVHRLVLEAFVGPCPPGMEACHFPNRDPADNRLENLRWDTHLANVEDRWDHGTMLFGETCPGAKLTTSEVLEIRRRKTQGDRHVDIAADFGISKANVEAIVYRRSWRHLP